MKGERATWSTPADIVAAVQRLWDGGALLAARLDGTALFPYEVRLRQPGVAVMGEQFELVRAWVAALKAGSRSECSHGYELQWRDINHRQLGRNSIPCAAVIATEAEALRMIGRVNDARRVDALAAATLDSFPALRIWVSNHPLRLLEHSDGWERILAVLRWFVVHPQPGIYLRQLDTHGVDTKFIEARKGLFAELLDQVLPPDAIVGTFGPRQFEERYGLLGKPPLIRFRMLDENHYIGGLSDLTVPVTQFAALRTGVERVFVTENEINALAFPPVRSGMVVFGGGYGIERLTGIGWLHDRDVAYWGDIDTHGFAILERLRAALPAARSVMMDASTFQAHRHLWGNEDADKRFIGELTRLTAGERELFLALRDNVIGERLRLEQERIAYAWVTSAIEQI
jgi:hypothetical protein